MIDEEADDHCAQEEYGENHPQYSSLVSSLPSISTDGHIDVPGG